ncbi:hypothetical protein C8J57DRAFT_1240302 [Mycena rebaudengoi]|nr:hypothetical protein C8J57DRAFT_1240302 [Mycena rebaudengoi]
MRVEVQAGWARERSWASPRQRAVASAGLAVSSVDFEERGSARGGVGEWSASVAVDDEEDCAAVDSRSVVSRTASWLRALSRILRREWRVEGVCLGCRWVDDGACRGAGRTDGAPAEVEGGEAIALRHDRCVRSRLVRPSRTRGGARPLRAGSVGPDRAVVDVNANWTQTQTSRYSLASTTLPVHFLSSRFWRGPAGASDLQYLLGV